MLYLIGLGLADGDVSLKAIETIKKCDLVYCETYTSQWNGDLDRLGNTIGKKIEILPREKVESDFLITEAKKKNIGLLVIGDPLTATTHMQLVMDAKENNVSAEVIHAPSIYTAIAETGLQLYKFGRSTTLVMPQNNFFPESPYDLIVENQKIGLHTLVLLDIPMTAIKGIGVLLEMENRKKKGAINDVIACCRLGTKNSVIAYGRPETLMHDTSLDILPSVLIIPGKLHFKEEEALKLWI